jgi:hypothetical protein
VSYVTSVYIVTGYASKAFDEAVTAPSDFGRGGLDTQFRALDTDAAGGTKYPSGDVYGAGLNYADPDVLAAWCDALPWSAWGVVTISTEGAYESLRVYLPGQPPIVHHVDDSP